MPLGSEPEEAAVAEVLGTLPVVVDVIFTSSKLIPKRPGNLHRISDLRVHPACPLPFRRDQTIRSRCRCHRDSLFFNWRSQERLVTATMVAFGLRNAGDWRIRCVHRLWCGISRERAGRLN